MASISQSQVAEEFEKLKSFYSFNFDSLKSKQLSLITDIVNGKDCFGLLPIGYGKSATFFLPPLLRSALENKKFYSLIVSPMKSLMLDQVDQLTACGIKSVALGPDMTEEQKKGFGIYSSFQATVVLMF